MAIQQILFFGSIVFFLLAIVLGVLAFLYFRKNEIRNVMDDLSGKSRAESIEKLRNSPKKFHTGVIGSKRPAASAVAVPAANASVPVVQNPSERGAHAKKREEKPVLVSTADDSATSVLGAEADDSSTMVLGAQGDDAATSVLGAEADDAATMVLGQAEEPQAEEPDAATMVLQNEEEPEVEAADDAATMVLETAETVEESDDSATVILSNDDSATEVLVSDDSATEVLTSDDSATQILESDESATEVLVSDDAATTILTNDDAPTQILGIDEVEPEDEESAATTILAEPAQQDEAPLGVPCDEAPAAEPIAFNIVKKLVLTESTSFVQASEE